MKPTRILLVLMRLATAIVPFAVSSCYVTPPSVSFYPPPPPRPVGITDRTSPNFYVLHQHRLASPPRGYVGDPGFGGGSNGGNWNGGAQNGSNQNGVGAGDSGSGGASGGGWSGDPNNGNVGSAGGWNGGNSNGNGGDQNGVSGGNSNGDPYGNGGGSSGPPPVPPPAPSQVTCAQGYVWREASSTDFVCVTPNARAQAAYDNSQTSARSAGGGDYGADTCVQGYVWREAFAGDHVCVTPQTRSQTANDNSLDGSRRVTTILTNPNFLPLHKN